MSIPKIIHYCWFGRNPLPPEVLQCIESWKKFCPDYEIKCWNEDNFDINQNRFCKQAYEHKKYAFLTDFARLKIIYEEGGIYLDTDVEVIKSFDDLLYNNVFFGAEGTNHINTGEGFGAEPKNEIIFENMKIYENIDCFDENGNLIAKNCPYYNTLVCENHGFKAPFTKVQNINGVVIYSNEYFNPYDWKNDKTNTTENTYSIHHYAGTWMTEDQKKALVINSKLDEIEKKYGKKVRILADYYIWNSKKNGGEGLFRTIMNRLIKR